MLWYSQQPWPACDSFSLTTNPMRCHIHDIFCSPFRDQTVEVTVLMKKSQHLQDYFCTGE